MRPRCHLVVFVRTPQVGRVKTRLAADIGAVAAAAFQRHATRAQLRRLAGDRRWRTVLAVTPDGDSARPRLWPRGCARMAQGGGDLGARMGRAMDAVGPGAVVLVGSDVPDIRPHHVAGAFRLLGRLDAVFGPARDGGYWLVGLARRRRTADLFKGVRWSSRHALADTVANLGSDRSVGFVETLDDIDDGAALARWRERGRGSPPSI